MITEPKISSSKPVGQTGPSYNKANNNKANKSPTHPVGGLVWLGRLAGLLVAVGLAVYNLGYSPAPWFDEGEHLRVAKTLVQYGQYAVWSADGFRYFGPTIGVGPTLLLPVALVFKLVGVGLVQARLVILLYLAGAALLYWFYARKLEGSGPVAWLALLLLLAAPGIAFINLGRQGLGEIPASAFFLAGLLVWLVNSERARPTWPGWTAAGAFFGLAAITKSNYGLLLPPALALAWLLNRFYYRQARLKWTAFALPFALTAGGLGGWYLVILLFLGGSDFATNFQLLRNASGGSAFVFSLERMTSAWKFFLGPQALFGLAAPGLIYAIWRARQRTAASFRLVLPLTFCLVWFGWFLGASVAWPRYAFPALLLCPIFTVKLLLDLPGLASAWLKRPSWQPKMQLITGLLLAGLIAGGLISQVPETLKVDDSAQQLAAYLDQQVDRQATIETWESELGFLTGHRYHYPPPEILDKAVRLKWLGGTGPSLAGVYQPEKLTPDYLIEGQFGRWNELYPAQLLNSRYRLIITFGDYKLYKRIG
ncbi:MAG: 4-amino-4-deoxy-L-arabinose transferase and related glycosyltransferase of family-like protein [Chloroflexi bacterium]|nr:4-amino-4-deoxy-L-arabinose transferase and related glycosyltransferase of family-like protein [Chloroflexota bacterium]